MLGGLSARYCLSVPESIEAVMVAMGGRFRAEEGKKSEGRGL